MELVLTKLKIVAGEAIQLERFDDYWQGKPALDKIELKVVDQPQMIKALEKGDIDLVDDTTGPMAKEAKNLKQFKSFIYSKSRLCNYWLCFS